MSSDPCEEDANACRLFGVHKKGGRRERAFLYSADPACDPAAGVVNESRSDTSTRRGDAVLHTCNESDFGATAHGDIAGQHGDACAQHRRGKLSRFSPPNFSHSHWDEHLMLCGQNKRLLAHLNTQAATPQARPVAAASSRVARLEHWSAVRAAWVSSNNRSAARKLLAAEVGRSMAGALLISMRLKRCVSR